MMKPGMIASMVLALGLAAAPALAAETCAGRSHCTEVSTFTMQLNDFRATEQYGTRSLIATATFQNRTDRPIILGYVSGSGTAIDEYGNRYTMISNGVRGIGQIGRSSFDPRFVLQPGERSDARFELSWPGGSQIAGVNFKLELAISEIDTVAGNQHRVGREHFLRFDGLRDGLVTAAPPAAPVADAPSAAAAAAGATPAPVTDPCEGKPNCYATGPFMAEAQANVSQDATYQHVSIRVRFRNLSNQPVILAYQEGSASMIDNQGNKYQPMSISGMGKVSRSSADPQFVLSPGEYRQATVVYRLHKGGKILGNAFTPDFVISQLEILPSQQVRSVRDYAVSFTGVATSPLGAAPGAVPGEAPDAVEALKKLGDLFKKKK